MLAESYRAAIPGASLVVADCPGFCSSSITEGISIVSRIQITRAIRYRAKRNKNELNQKKSLIIKKRVRAREECRPKDQRFERRGRGKDKGDKTGRTIKTPGQRVREEMIAKMTIDLRYRLRLNVETGERHERVRERERERGRVVQWGMKVT